ncbi:P-loop containing nucleoside triphosphate hydrolase protein, partial [Fusarium tricinctum]
IPFLENLDFIGRTAIVNKLKQKLFDTNSRRKVALVGLGGTGKTQIALHLAHCVKAERQGWSVFWLPAFSMAGFEQECAKLVKNLDIQYSESEDVKEVFQRYLNSGRIGRWFLIIDNADDLEILKPSGDTAKGIFDFLPNHVDGRILFTTRFMRVAVVVAMNQAVKVSEMDFEEASELLRASFINDDEFWADEMRHGTTVVKLLKTLTYLPLAITQATAYMNTNQTSIKDYLKLFEHTDKKNVMELLEHGQDSETYYDKSQSAVATTWVVSFNRIRSSDPAAADLLSFISTIEPRAIPRSLLPIFETEQQLERAIGTLLGYGFLTRRGQEVIYDMHRLVHLAALRWNQEGHHAQDVQQLSLAHVAKIFPGHHWESREVYQQYLPHAQRLLDNTDKFENGAACGLGQKVGLCLLAEGYIERAMHMLKHVDMIQERKLPESDRRRLETQFTLACTYMGSGQNQEAIRLLGHVDNIQREILKEDDPRRLGTQLQLAIGYRNNGQFQESIELLEHVVAIQGKLTEGNKDRLASQSLLAATYVEVGRVEEAIDLQEYVIARQMVVLPQDHPDQLLSQNSLARAYIEIGRVEEAIDLQEYVVARWKKILPQDHQHQLTSRHDLAKAYVNNGQIEEAIELLEDMIARQKDILPDHHDQLTLRHSLALAYVKNEQIKEGIELLEYVIAREEETLPRDHPDRLASQHVLAVAYLNNGQTKEAIELLEYVVAREKDTLPKDHPGQLTSLHNLALAYLDNRQINKAIELLEFVVTRKKEILPSGHPNILSSEKTLIRCLEIRNKGK